MKYQTQVLDKSEINNAARILQNGGLVAFPTETVYGIGADATNSNAVARIYEAKNRPSFNPLIVHLPSYKEAQTIGVFSDLAAKIASAFWPGPLTIVVPLRPDVSIASLVTAGLDSIALRVPAHPIAQELLKASQRPLAAPSANPSGQLSPTHADHVKDGLSGRIEAIIEGGVSEVGLESTIIDCRSNTPILLRPGAITADEIAALIGDDVPHIQSQGGAAPRAPGQLSSHYAPNAHVLMDMNICPDHCAYLAFGNTTITGNHVLNLSPSGDLREAASNLFNMLHLIDKIAEKEGKTTIAVAPIPSEGIGIAINDRLARAAAPRP